jgi:hypothetical protein
VKPIAEQPGAVETHRDFIDRRVYELLRSGLKYLPAVAQAELEWASAPRREAA